MKSVVIHRDSTVVRLNPEKPPGDTSTEAGPSPRTHNSASLHVQSDGHALALQWSSSMEKHLSRSTFKRAITSWAFHPTRSTRAVAGLLDGGLYGVDLEASQVFLLGFIAAPPTGTTPSTSAASPACKIAALTFARPPNQRKSDDSGDDWWVVGCAAPFAATSSGHGGVPMLFVLDWETGEKLYEWQLRDALLAPPPPLSHDKGSLLHESPVHELLVDPTSHRARQIVCCSADHLSLWEWQPVAGNAATEENSLTTQQGPSSTTLVDRYVPKAKPPSAEAVEGSFRLRAVSPRLGPQGARHGRHGASVWGRTVWTSAGLLTALGDASGQMRSIWQFTLPQWTPPSSPSIETMSEIEVVEEVQVLPCSKKVKTPFAFSSIVMASAQHVVVSAEEEEGTRIRLGVLDAVSLEGVGCQSIALPRVEQASKVRQLAVVAGPPSSSAEDVLIGVVMEDGNAFIVELWSGLCRWMMKRSAHTLHPHSHPSAATPASISSNRFRVYRQTAALRSTPSASSRPRPSTALKHSRKGGVQALHLSFGKAFAAVIDEDGETCYFYHVYTAVESFRLEQLYGLEEHLGPGSEGDPRRADQAASCLPWWMPSQSSASSYWEQLCHVVGCRTSMKGCLRKDWGLKWLNGTALASTSAFGPCISSPKPSGGSPLHAEGDRGSCSHFTLYPLLFEEEEVEAEVVTDGGTEASKRLALAFPAWRTTPTVVHPLSPQAQLLPSTVRYQSHIDKLRSHLAQCGAFPNAYRACVWRFLLGLPPHRQTAALFARLERQAFATSATEEAVQRMMDSYELGVPESASEAKKTREPLQRLLKQALSLLLCHSPGLSGWTSLPSFVFPFAHVFSGSAVSSTGGTGRGEPDLQSLVEVLFVILKNWSVYLFQQPCSPPLGLLTRALEELPSTNAVPHVQLCDPSPEPPRRPHDLHPLLAFLSQLLKVVDPFLLHHFDRMDISVRVWGWELLLSLYTSTLSASEWLQMMDHAICMPPLWLLVFHVALLKTRRMELLDCTTEFLVEKVLSVEARLSGPSPMNFRRATTNSFVEENFSIATAIREAHRLFKLYGFATLTAGTASAPSNAPLAGRNPWAVVTHMLPLSALESSSPLPVLVAIPRGLLYMESFPHWARHGASDIGNGGRSDAFVWRYPAPFGSEKTSLKETHKPNKSEETPRMRLPIDNLVQRDANGVSNERYIDGWPSDVSISPVVPVKGYPHHILRGIPSLPCVSDALSHCSPQRRLPVDLI